MPIDYSLLKKDENDPSSAFNQTFNGIGGSYWKDPSNIGKTADQVGIDSQGSFTTGQGGGSNVYMGNNHFGTAAEYQQLIHPADPANLTPSINNPVSSPIAGSNSQGGIIPQGGISPGTTPLTDKVPLASPGFGLTNTSQLPPITDPLSSPSSLISNTPMPSNIAPISGTTSIGPQVATSGGVAPTNINKSGINQSVVAQPDMPSMTTSASRNKLATFGAI